MRNIFKLFEKNGLNNAIFFEHGEKKLDDGIDEARAGVEMEAGDDLIDNICKVIVISFDFDDRIDDAEVLSQYLWIFFDPLLVIDAAGPHMFEATIVRVIFIDDKVEDVLDIEDVQAILDLLQVKSLHEVKVVLKH